MFVLLEHDPTASGEPSSAGQAVHWDLLVEAAGRELLVAWRLARNPLSTSGAIHAERLKDHRRLYLDYEGEISGGRGRVKRIDRGPAHIEGLDEATTIVALSGRALRGRFEITRAPGGQTMFRPLPPP